MKSIEPAGDCSLFFEVGEGIRASLARKIFTLSSAIKKGCPEVSEIVPCYTGLTIYFNPLSTDTGKLVAKLGSIADSIEETGTDIESRTVTIPVLYGGESGPDLQYVADRNSLTFDDVIRLHTEGKYIVYMLGFTPGFPFLGGLNSKLETPRRNTPREMVPAGSVGIAGNQTGIYPLDSPGGWQVIGQTPLRLFDRESAESFLLNAGDSIVFRSIDKEEFSGIQEAVNNGLYVTDIKSCRK